MASRQDISAGRAFVELYVKNSPLLKGLSQITSAVKGVSSTLMGVGAGIAAAGVGAAVELGGAVAVFASMGSELADVAARTGETVGSLAELKFAAEQTGAELSDVERAIMMMQKKGVVGTFDEIAAKIAAIEDPAKRTQAAIENWGKSGTKLLPMVNSLAELRAQARQFGLVPTEKAVQDADTIGDLFDQIKSVGKAAMFEIGAAVAPVVIPALEAVRTLGIAFVLALKKVPAMVQAASDAIMSIGGVFGELRDTFATTWGGIVDAISAGDLELAGRIAWAGLMVVWEESTQGINQLWEETKVFFLNTWDEATTGIAKGFVTAMATIQTIWTETAASLKAVWQQVTDFMSFSMLHVEGVSAGVGLELLTQLGFIDEKTAGIARGVADAGREKRIGDLASGNQSALAAIEAKKAKDLAAIEANRVGAGGALDDGSAARRAAREKAMNDDIDAKRKALEAAKEDLKNVRAEAAAKPKMEIGPLGDMAGPSIEAAAKVVGNFSAAGLAAAGRGTDRNKQVNELINHALKQVALLDRVLKATEKIPKAKPFQVGGVM